MWDQSTVAIGGFGKLMRLLSRSGRPRKTGKIFRKEWEVKVQVIRSRTMLW